MVADDNPHFLAPAMNMHMWVNSITKDNCIKLQRHGYVIWEPEIGLQAWGDNGPGRTVVSETIGMIPSQLVSVA